LFNTVVKSQLHFKKNPWKNVMISGFVTLKGEKMSKSKGNVVRPQEVLKKYGADAIRFWAASSKLGKDFDYQEKDLITGKKFVNKLLNASRFVFMNLEDYRGEKLKKLEKLDELFLKRLDVVVRNVTKSFETYEYSKAKSEIDGFFWNEFTSNYLELVKGRVYRGEGDKKISAQYTLYKTLLAILKMIAPIMPFIAEEIYQTYFRKTETEKSIHISTWPEFDSKVRDTDELKILYSEIGKVRQVKSVENKPMNAEIILTLPLENLKIFENMIDDLQAVTNAREIKEGKFGVKFV